MEKKNKIWLCTSVILFLIGAGLLCAGLVVELSVFPKLMKNGVNDGKVLGLNSDGTYNSFTNDWANSAYISTMEYWTFDYKNTLGMLNRAIFPDVLEKGPYAYVESFINDNIAFSDDGTKMNFSQATKYVFSAEKSCPTCDPYKDTVTIPDISFSVAMDALDEVVGNVLHNPEIQGLCQKLNIVDKCKSIATLVEAELGTLVDFFGVGPFVTVTVDQLLFSGYQTPMVDKVVNKIINFLNVLMGTELFKKITPPLVALNTLNATTGFLYECDTGKEDSQRSGFILSFSNITNTTESSVGTNLPADWWPTANTGKCTGFNGKHALKIDGTNGNYFKSFIKRGDVLPLYVEALCRTINLVYDRDITFQGVSGYRFVLPPSEFDYDLDLNCGFCNPLQYGAYNSPANTSCFPSGLLDISKCSGDVPILISKAHFYQADPVVQQFVPRFKPTYENDETTIDIEPTTGTVLVAMKKLQISTFVNQLKHINAYSVIRPGAYPLTWLNESFIFDKGTRDQLYSQLFTPKKILAIVCYSAVGVGGLLMVISAIIMFAVFAVERKGKKVI